MRNPVSLLDWNLGGRDLNALVNLHRITINDLAAHLKGHRDTERALTRRRRSHNCDDASADVSSAFFRLGLSCFAHPRAIISRIAITSQMTTSNRIAPMIWLREKRII